MSLYGKYSKKFSKKVAVLKSGLHFQFVGQVTSYKISTQRPNFNLILMTIHYVENF